MVFGMTAWVLRATALGVLAVALRAVLGLAMVYWPTQGTWMRLLCLVVLIGAAVAWGIRDGRRAKAANLAGEDEPDLTIRWLTAGVVGGIGSGLLAWIVEWIPRFDLGDNGFLFELTAGAAFIVLLIFVPAAIGLGIGRWLVGRKEDASEPEPTGQIADSAA